ncbi:MAG: helix-turn-helix domain-containing protein, partial [Candidatus Dormibacteraeota bacterium]|nr:helix-turn-helix domain-containing protein [Candidatus Dormibacteraeota bacterium]
SKYRSEFCDRARTLCERGARDIDLAAAFGVNVSTIYVWKNEFPEFREALNRAKDIADDMVEVALFRRATGYSYDTVKLNIIDGKVVETPVVDQFAPDTTACIFWLKNRRQKEWRDKQELTTEVKMERPYDLALLSQEERDTMRAMLVKAGEKRTTEAG